VRALLKGLVLVVVLCLSACQGDPEDVATTTTRADRARVLQFWDRFRAATERRTGRDCAGAIALYREALALDPKHEDSLYYLGQCLRERHQPLEARDAFEKLVAVNPHSARGHLALGGLLASPDPSEPFDLETAEREFRRAQEINGEETGPIVRLAEVLLVEGRLDEARHWLESAVRTNPKSVEAAFLASYAVWEAKDLAHARGLADKARQAAHVEAPVKGVLNEGDRKAGGGSSQRAAPPLESPMGRLLFGDPVALMRAAGREPPGKDTLDIQAAWLSVQRARGEYGQRWRRARAESETKRAS
jgi:tetratricopeptide (TPR) repeat protein